VQHHLPRQRPLRTGDLPTTLTWYGVPGTVPGKAFAPTGIGYTWKNVKAKKVIHLFTNGAT
jgi:hypothetical protein